jgi:hypothetical protein
VNLLEVFCPLSGKGYALFVANRLH